MALLLCGFSQSAEAAVRYVKSDSSAADGSGLTWVTAFITVTAALNAASPGDQIWVAAGTYYERVTLKDGVALYGGFAGTETTLDQRDWKANVSILDGQSGGTVVTAFGLSSTATRIDGFTIQNGSNSGLYCSSSSPTISNNTISGNTASSYGGGIYLNDNSSPTISNNTISGNETGQGGGIFCFSSSPTIRNNTINENKASSSGGGIYCWNNSSPTISNNTVSRNTAYSGGGIFCSYSSPTISNNTINGNKAPLGGGIDCYSSSSIIINNTISGNETDEGGGIFCSSSSLTISNNRISENMSTYFGGGICCFTSSPTISNNTISGNTASSDGGGIYLDENSSPTISNNIIAFNNSGIYAYNSSSSPTLSHNCVYSNTSYNYSGLSAGSGDIQKDPLFLDRNTRNFRLQKGSPCIDTGNSVIDVGTTDLDGNARIFGNCIDIGAYEWYYVTAVLSTTAGNPTNGSTIPVTVTFNKAVTGFELNDLTIGNGSAANISGSGTTYTVDIIPGSQGELTVDIAEGVVHDALGYQNGAVTKLSVTYDSVSPTGTLGINSGSELTYNLAATLTITVNDGSGCGVSQIRFSNDNQTWSDWENFITSKSWALGAATDGICTIYAEIQDLAGNIGVISDTIVIKATIPTINPTSGTYNILAVSMKCATTGAEIRYTTDGSEPTENSTLYSGIPLTLSADTTVTAKSFMSGWTVSDSVSANYTINSTTATYQPGFNDPPTSANLLQTAQNFENDLAVQFNSTTLWMGKGKTGKISDLWLYYPNLIGYGTGQIRENVKIVSAKLVLTVKGFKGNPYLAHKINLYQISDPDNLGAPYFGESGLRNGLDYQYRDHRPGRNVKWTNNDKNGDGNANLGDLISGNTPVDTYEVIPAYFNEEGDTQIRLDVTESIKSWLTGNPNHGWFLSGDAADKWSFDDGVEFYGITDSIIANRPKLEVTFLDTDADNNPPGIVTNLNADCASGQVSLSWNNPTDNDFSGVLILRKVGLIPTDPTDGLAVYDQQGTVGSLVTYRDTGITNDQTFYYAVFTYDNLRNYSRGISIKAIPTAGGRAPDAPAGLTVGLNGNALTFSWTDQSSDEKWFLLEQQKGTGDFVTVACPAANQQSFTTTLDDPDFELTPNTNYTYRISAVNDYGASIPSATYSLNTGAFLQSPANLAWTIISAGRVNVSWTNQAPDATGYRVAVCNSSREELWSYSLAADVESFSVTGLKPGMEYLIKVVVVKGIETAAVWTEPIITAVDSKGGLL